MNRKVMKLCRGCGKERRIRTDRHFCSTGCATRHRARERRVTTLTAVAGDIHIPQHDERAVDLFLRWLKDNPVDRVILNGDILDCYEISRWKQPGSPGPGLAYEVQEGRRFLAKVREAVGPRAQIDWVEGNHCFRFRAYIANEAPSIAGLEHNVTLHDQLHFKAHGVNFIRCPGSKWFSTFIEAAPGVLVGHFNKTSVNAGVVAKALLDRHGTSVITGHGHCMGMSHRTHHSGPIFGYEGGCLCDLHPPYCEPHHWAQGFTVIYEREGLPPAIQPIIFNRHTFVYGGKFYA